MKKYLSALIAVCLIFSLATCNKNQTGTSSANRRTHNNSEAVPTISIDEQSGIAYTSNVQQTTSEQQEVSEDGSKTLIAYFTWADNTVVHNPNEIDVDATTSASVLPPGNAALIASWIREEVGGDLFSMVVTEPYPSDYDECLDIAADEKAANARPTLSTKVENMEQYDTVFIGYPNWMYSCPMAVLTFIEEYDLSGKTVILFCTHGTGGLASSVRDITAVLPDNVTLINNVLGVYRPEVSSSEEEVKAWIDELELF